MLSDQSAGRKKLIEVSMPLEAINAASGREKSIRHGHPSTLHLWWARRPLAACRAVLFGQLVDDPSAWPDQFPTEEAQERERERLHDVIRAFVEWPGSKPSEQAKWQRALDAARLEIARSIARCRGEESPSGPPGVLAYLAEHAPPVYDPFCGGGSIPLEAQRLGLRAYGSDLNPVAVLISKALVEIPPTFAGIAPIHPGAERDLRHWQGAQGLAKDVRFYGEWMRDQAMARLGSLYPDATLRDGRKATVIAWLWARTVRSPDPSVRGAMVPLASSFVLSAKAGREAVVRVLRDPSASDGWHFAVKSGDVATVELEAARHGTKGKGSNFSCVLSGAPIYGEYIRSEGRSGRLGSRLMAIVAEGNRERLYLSPTPDHEAAAKSAGTFGITGDEAIASAARRTFLSGATPAKLTGGTCHIYGLDTWGSLFTARQIVALTTLSDLVGAARAKVRADAEEQFGARGLTEDHRSLVDGGKGPHAYADAVATYLGLLISRRTDRNNSLCTWDSGPVSTKASTGGSARTASVRSTFTRQAIPMTWDFAEASPFSESGGGFLSGIDWVVAAIERTPAAPSGSIFHVDAAANSYPVHPVVVSTDPPYYDNIGYADLSDFFYVWLRRSLSDVWPNLFRRLQTPKQEELVATAYRFGGREAAEAHFMAGMSRALRAVREASVPNIPLAIYYAFKQSEKTADGVSSPGWASFLQAVIAAGLVVDGTWPVRTELSNRMIGMGTNALASSIVLSCRARPSNGPSATRTGFMAELRRELPDALARMRMAGLHPVDLPQSALGPGMAVFSKYAVVREPDDSAMSVALAIALINQVRGETDEAEIGALDPETRFALDWFASFGWNEREAGEAIKLGQSYDRTERQLREAGILVAERGKARLRRRPEMDPEWRPSTDRTQTVWELAQALNRALHDAGGVRAAGALLAEAQHMGVDASWLAGRLFRISEERRMTDEALGWGNLAQAWGEIEAAAGEGTPAPAVQAQPELI
ncbi:MAG TPA: DUF1156 domain-containing protein [Caulobacteraceae bacterium]|nr:DUF1156 domain-containing protein [Caulobacteraceae bacterium]